MQDNGGGARVRARAVAHGGVHADGGGGGMEGWREGERVSEITNGERRRERIPQ